MVFNFKDLAISVPDGDLFTEIGTMCPANSTCVICMCASAYQEMPLEQHSANLAILKQQLRQSLE